MIENDLLDRYTLLTNNLRLQLTILESYLLENCSEYHSIVVNCICKTFIRLTTVLTPPTKPKIGEAITQIVEQHNKK